jgi:hypothetical protein
MLVPTRLAVEPRFERVEDEYLSNTLPMLCCTNLGSQIRYARLAGQVTCTEEGFVGDMLCIDSLTTTTRGISSDFWCAIEVAEPTCFC